MYKRLILPLLFRFDAETIHHVVTSLLKIIFAIPGTSAISQKLYVVDDPRLARTVFGLTFPNPVGMAAGFDKNAELVNELGNLGFGFVEIGTVTPRPQPGNPRPRLFRLKADSGLVNRMGFNNKGSGPAADRLRSFNQNRVVQYPGSQRIIVGGNIGKNKDTANENALSDYMTGFCELFDVVDYFAVNVSSPNTPGLRDLQEREPLTRLLTALQRENRQRPVSKPILLKIAPDLTNGQLDDIIAIVRETGIAGVIATNTTTSRDNLTTDPAAVARMGAGGVSGQPLRKRATDVIRYLHEKSGGSFPIVGVGGISSANDALEKLRAGASLVQVYTSFVYEGPGLAKRINRALLTEAVAVPVSTSL